MTATHSPEDVVWTAVAALEERRWNDLLAVLQPSSLEGWRAQVLASAQSHQQGPPTAEELRAREPGMPVEAAEWQASRLRQGWAQEPSTLKALNASSVEELEALPTPDLLARWLEAADPRSRTQRALVAHGVPAQCWEEAPPVRRVVLGSVVEGDTLAHVLHREVLGPAGSDDHESAGAVRVVELRRTPDGWRIPMDFALFGFIGWFVSYSSSEANAR